MYKSIELKTELNSWKRNIQNFPNLRYLGSPDLRKKCTPIKKFDTATKRDLNKIKRTFINFRSKTGLGRGMAAPQIGIIRKIITIMNRNNEVIILVNPLIKKSSIEQLTIAEELCMSLGNLTATVIRPKFITVSYLNEEGKRSILEADEKESRILQHEIDHLEGILNIDKAIKNGLRFVYSMKQFKGIRNLNLNDPCPCGATDKNGKPKKYKKCCGKK